MTAPGTAALVLPPEQGRAVIDPASYAQWEGLLDLFDRLREEAPVARVEAPDGIHPPFWLVTRYDDVMRISKDNATFLNNPQTVVLPLALGPLCPLTRRAAKQLAAISVSPQTGESKVPSLATP